MQIGAQLWVFSKIEDEREMDDILAQLAGADYTCVEAMLGRIPRSRASLERVGLTCYSVHVALSGLPSEDDLLRAAHDLGAEAVCVSGLLRWQEREAEDYRRAGDALNHLGRRLQQAGLALHYHNHDFEFDLLEPDTTGIDLLMDTLDPATTSLCFDAGWATVAGHDPVQFMRRYAPRIGSLHLRDFQGRESLPLGRGTIAQAPIVAAMTQLPNLRIALVEQDPTTVTPLADMLASRQYLKAHFGL